MNSRTLVLFGAAALAAFFPPALRAQDTPTTPAAQPAPVATTQTPAKKVWTNEDVGDLRDHSPVSTVGSTKPAAKSTPGSARSGQRNTNSANAYRAQIARLQAQLPPLAEKINELQSALSGNQVTEARHFGGVRPDNWKDELARLQKQRDDIQTKIATLEDQARHTRAPANQIP